MRIDDLRPSLADRIRSDHPDLPRGARISREELGRYRMRYMEELLQQEHGEFSELDHAGGGIDRQAGHDLGELGRGI
ncbi:hypothetical protein ACVOMV_08310 [Mesorhizobium atlanticum]